MFYVFLSVFKGALVRNPLSVLSQVYSCVRFRGGQHLALCCELRLARVCGSERPDERIHEQHDHRSRVGFLYLSSTLSEIDVEPEVIPNQGGPQLKSRFENHGSSLRLC